MATQTQNKPNRYDLLKVENENLKKEIQKLKDKSDKTNKSEKSEVTVKEIKEPVIVKIKLTKIDYFKHLFIYLSLITLIIYSILR